MGGSAVPTKFSQIIGGKLFDISKATEIAGDDYWDGSNCTRSGRNTILYRTLKGNFFLGHYTCWQGERDSLEPISKEEAKEWYESLSEQRLSYEEAFGEPPEEA